MDDAQWGRLVSAMRQGPPKVVERDARPIVFFHTPWRRPDDGWSVAARAYARAMEMGGIRVHLVSWDPSEALMPLVDEVVREAGRFDGYPREWDLHLFSCVFAGIQRLGPILKNLRAEPGPQAYHCVFERQTMEPELATALNSLNGVWAQCSENRDVLERNGVENVTLIPQPYFDGDPFFDIPTPKQNRRFYWVGRFEPRKAPDRLVLAFLRAFEPGEATLTLKLSSYGHPGKYPNAKASILEALKDPDVVKNGWGHLNWFESIFLVRGRLSGDEMLQLHAANDVYVSASRGEGLDLPAFDAKKAGRKLLLTQSGGPRDFIEEGDTVVPAIGLVEADSSYPWGEGAMYYDHQLEALVTALQQARRVTPVGSRLSSKFYGAKVGAQFREWVGRLTGR